MPRTICWLEGDIAWCPTYVFEREYQLISLVDKIVLVWTWPYILQLVAVKINCLLFYFCCWQYPYIPAHITKPKEHKRLYFVQLQEKGKCSSLYIGLLLLKDFKGSCLILGDKLCSNLCWEEVGRERSEKQITKCWIALNTSVIICGFLWY